MRFDVSSLFDRRADERWNRVCTADMLERVTWSTPEKVALIGMPGAVSDTRYSRLTYREANALANQVGHGLLKSGVARGDRVAMIVENSVEGYICRMGAAKIGAVISPINPSLRKDLIEYILRLLEPKFVIVDAELMDQVRDGLQVADIEVDVTIEIGGEVVPGSQTFSDFVKTQPTSEPEGQIHGDDIAEILFTSGTTANPKGAMLSHTSSTLAAYGFALSLTRNLKMERDLVTVTALPMMYHIGHQIFGLATFAAGGTLVIGRSPDPSAVSDALIAENATALWGGSPALIDGVTAELQTRAARLPDLKMVVYGWAALPPAVTDRLRAIAPDFQPMGIFGQTESISCHRYWPDEDPDLYERTSPKDNYVGLPSPLLASSVMDPMGEPISPDSSEVGEAVYRSPVMTAGYYLDEKATQQAFAGGWFHSGDSCTTGENGNRIMVDRIKDIVKTGGENVSSLRVESILMQHPSVQQVAVIGLADEKWGEAVTAVIVPQGDPVDPANIIAFARERLAGFETPKKVIYQSALPSTVGGKVLKYKLRRELDAAENGAS